MFHASLCAFEHENLWLYGFQELFAFFFGEMTPGAFGQIPEFDIGNPDPFQGGNAIVCFFDHTANLSIPAFFELDEKAFAGKPLNNGGAGFFSKNGDAFFQYCERTVGHGGRNGHDVFLFVIKGRVQQMVVEVSVIGHEQEPG